MTLRELLDDTILRLGLCDRVDLLAVRKFLDGIEAQRASMAKQGLADQLEPEAAAMCACGHPYAPGHQTPGTECARGTCQCDRFELAGPAMKRYLDAEADAAVRRSAVADFAPERHLTPAGGADPYLELHVEYDHEGGAG